MLVEQLRLDDGDDLRGGLLDRIHEAREDRRAVLLPGVAGNVRE